MQLGAQVDELRARGSRVETIFPGSSFEHMFGANAMDLSLRPPAARAGYDQGRARAGQLSEFWGPRTRIQSTQGIPKRYPVPLGMCTSRRNHLTATVPLSALR